MNNIFVMCLVYEGISFLHNIHWGIRFPRTNIITTWFGLLVTTLSIIFILCLMVYNIIVVSLLMTLLLNKCTNGWWCHGWWMDVFLLRWSRPVDRLLLTGYLSSLGCAQCMTIRWIKSKFISIKLHLNKCVMKYYISWMIEFWTKQSLSKRP